MVRADTQPAIGQPASAQPEMLRGIGIDQRLDQPVPLDLVFRDETGTRRHARQSVRGKPVILNLVYYECPMLCTLVLNGLLSAMKALPFDAGREFDVVTVSFDPADTAALAARRKRRTSSSTGDPEPSAAGTFSPAMRRRSSGSRGGRLPLPLRPGAQASSPTPPVSPC